MKAMLEFFSKIKSDLPKAVILGEMKELGPIAEVEHRKMLDYLHGQSFDKIYLVGSVFADGVTGSITTKNTFVFERVEQLIEELKRHPLSGYYVLLKGSHSVQLEKVIPFL